MFCIGHCCSFMFCFEKLLCLTERSQEWEVRIVVYLFKHCILIMLWYWKQIRQIHLSLSSISWMWTISFFSCLEWELIFPLLSHRLGIEYLHAWNFFNFFKSPSYCFSVLEALKEGKECYKISRDSSKGNSRILRLSSFSRETMILLPSTLSWEESISLLLSTKSWKCEAYIKTL